MTISAANPTPTYSSAAALEWLETNGLGDFACGTVAGSNTRRGHGLFVAGGARPMLLLAALDVCIEREGERFALSTHQFADTIHPEGYRLCARFRLDPFPEWRYEFNGGALTCRIFMPAGRRYVVTLWELDAASAPGPWRLRARPLFAYRNLDALTHANLDANLALRPSLDGFAILPYPGCPEMSVRCPGATVRFDPVWYYRFRHDEDIALGRGAEEDFFTPCELTYELAPGKTAWLVAGLADRAAIMPCEGLFSPSQGWQPSEEPCEGPNEPSQGQIVPSALETQERIRREGLTLPSVEADPTSRILARAAEAFCVRSYVARTIPSTCSGPRAESSGQSALRPEGPQEAEAVGTHDDRRLDLSAEASAKADSPHHIGCPQRLEALETSVEILTGYPGVSRDLRSGLIALPGLLLAMRRLAEAKSYLSAALAELNARSALGDEALWFIRAAELYVDHSRDWEFLRAELAPGCLALTERLAGEKPDSGLRLDADGLLLCAGGAPLTWMNAVAAGSPVTPRAGKAVEVNALWHAALGLLARWAGRLGREEAAQRWAAVRELCGRSFRMRFWNAGRGCLFDAVDTPAGNDPAIRPNQLLAVALPADLLDRAQASAVLEIVEKRLLAPGGLRTLSLEDPSFVPAGAEEAALHQGSVHPWLIGFYADAVFRVHGRTPRAYARVETALAWLTQEHLKQGCVGQVGERFDGAAPHAPRGLIAHAPAVGELVRAWTEVRGRGW